MKFADCEDYLEHHGRHGVQLIGTEFSEVEDITVPSRLGNNNIAWPQGWTPEEKRAWRAMMEMPGHFCPAAAVPKTVKVPDWYGRYLRGKRRAAKRALIKQKIRWLLHLD